MHSSGLAPGRAGAVSKPPESFKRYVSQYDRWREVARSLRQGIDVEAARDAFRDEANRQASRSKCSDQERRADS